MPLVWRLTCSRLAAQPRCYIWALSTDLHWHCSTSSAIVLIASTPLENAHAHLLPPFACRRNTTRRLQLQQPQQMCWQLGPRQTCQGQMQTAWRSQPQLSRRRRSQRKGQLMQVGTCQPQLVLAEASFCARELRASLSGCCSMQSSPGFPACITGHCQSACGMLEGSIVHPPMCRGGA